ncbi:MAG: NFACT family protein [Clostridiales bacterium]|nr:NFACT family protein [Clostridiales bacterium]
MALDGLVIANVIKELNDTLLGGRINKISQPENDALVLVIKNNRSQYKLFLSANASLPLIYLTQENKPNPITAPNFCMLLRKHLNSARILSITQPGLERIIDIEIEHLNELGDVCTKHLITEIMGKHSNIIFCDDKKMIIDSIKHISGLVSSVREVLPGRDYFIPETQDKWNPLTVDCEHFLEKVMTKPLPIAKALYTSLTGISPLIANEICHRASIDGEASTSSLSEMEGLHLYKNFERLMADIKDNRFCPNIIYKNGEPVEFSSTTLTTYNSSEHKEFESISELLEQYYAQRNTLTRIRQKSVDLRKIVSNAIERTRKKYDLQMKQLKDTDKRDKYKVYGELITAYGYNVEEGSKQMTALNYYTNEEVTIPLDPTITPIENAKKYFDKYSKLKRTYEALTKFTEETKEELEHLESISAALDIALQEEDLIQLKEELMEYGYMKRKFVSKKDAKKQKSASKPFHYISSDGFHMYVGKNNFQNDELTFKFAVGNDWWFHAKGMAGSHVIVKTNGEELPDRTFEEAGKLAAYYSKARELSKAEIDYTEKKNVKKPNGGKPGFVVYYTNYSFIIEPDITGIEEVK